MKMKYILGTLAVVAVGVGVYYVVKNKNLYEKCNMKEYKNIKEPNDEPDILFEQEKDMEEAIYHFSTDKSEAYDAMMERHKEAAEQMKQSLENIIDETEDETITSENEKDLEEMGEALDRLLEE